MLMVKTNKMLVFKEKGHKYVDDKGEEWTSVTSLIKRFQPEVDWDKIAEKYSKKHKVPVETIKKQWKKENKVAIERGIKFHKQREEDLLSCQTIVEEGKELFMFRPTFDEYGNKLAPPQKLQEGIYSELLVALNSARICGQADYVVISDNVIKINDFKTNKAINKNGYVNWKGDEERMTGPLSNIPNSNYWHYTLQLNTYAYIIKKNNPSLKIGKLQLMHALFEDDGEVGDVIVYDLPIIQREVDSMINYHKCQISQEKFSGAK